MHTLSVPNREALPGTDLGVSFFLPTQRPTKIYFYQNNRQSASEFEKLQTFQGSAKLGQDL